MKALILLFVTFAMTAYGAEGVKKMTSSKPWTNFSKPAKAELKKKLTPLQYEVTQEEGTERPFTNDFWDNKKAGIYVDVVSGEPLFSSKDKFDSGTGWPSFTKPLTSEQIVTKQDRRLFSTRTEVRSKMADSHLGHVFDDGPRADKHPSGTGQRYCMNSAAMRFIPAEDLEAQGYGEYAKLFSDEVGKNQKATTTQSNVATLAGGCFWGVEELLRALPGVTNTYVGYTGGVIPNPNYEIVKTGTSGHAESIQVEFDPKKTSYEEILKFFFRIHDPTTRNQQGNDKGTQYRSVIFYHNDEQKKIAERVRAQVDESGKWKSPVVTEIVPAKPFYKAEDYHQDYLQKNPRGYTCHFIRD
jgi:peptide methionine sulfoxide reductase msrA/msrB